MATDARAMVEEQASADVERFKREIYDEWQTPEIVAAYRKWDAAERAWGSKATELIADRARLTPGMTVLDLAGGHGEPALALAGAVGSTGHVTATDQGVALLALAEEEAQRRGLANMTFRAADAHALPFPDGTFDRVTSRLGVMYFVELARALGECRRVLKPGGRVTFVAWGSPEQPLFEILLGPLFRQITPPEPEPGAPSPFTFAEPGSLSDALRDAGFREVEEETTTVPTPFPGTPQQYWDWWWEMVPPLQPLLAALPTSRLASVMAETVSALSAYDDGTHVTIPIRVVVASGHR